MIFTERLTILPWSEDQVKDLEKMNLEPEVYELLGGPDLAKGSVAAVKRYQDDFVAKGWGVMRIEDRFGEFIGLAGLQYANSLLPVAPAVEAVWRFRRTAWGKGYANEAMSSIMRLLPPQANLEEILALIASPNVRSAKTARRIGFMRDSERDFMYPSESIPVALRPHHVYCLSLSRFRA